MRQWLLAFAACALAASNAMGETQSGKPYEPGRAASESELTPQNEGAVRPLTSSSGTEQAIRDLGEDLAMIRHMREQLVGTLRQMGASLFDAELDHVTQQEPAMMSERPEIAPARSDDMYHDCLAQWSAIKESRHRANQSGSSRWEAIDRELSTSAHHVADVGQMMAGGDHPSVQHVVEHCAVLFLLSTEDSTWNRPDTMALPSWMRRENELAMLESFALRIRRPRTAYEFYVHRTGPRRDDQSSSVDPYPTFLLLHARALQENSDLATVLHCLRDGTRWSETRGNSEAAIALLCRMAALLDVAGYPGLAAEEARRAIDVGEQSSLSGYAVIARLIYLYRARQFEDVVQEATKWMSDDRADQHQPRLLYLMWRAYRDLGDTDRSHMVRRDFLHRFPGHLLAADTCLEKAITALAQGRVSEAERLLYIIETQHPEFHGMDKVLALRSKLPQQQQR